MKKITFATAASGALAVLAIVLAGPAVADAGSGSNVHSPAPVYPQSAYGGTNPYTPYGVGPYVPYGVWAQH
jgi:phospholipase C